MLRRLLNLIGAELGSAGHAPAGVPDAVFAAAVLLVEAANLDDTFDPRERAAVATLLRDRLHVPAAEVDGLIDRAAAAGDTAAGLVRYSKAIKDAFDEGERIALMEMLWEVVYADGRVHDLESNLMRRLAGLLYVPDTENGAARRRAAGRTTGTGSDAPDAG